MALRYKQNRTTNPTAPRLFIYASTADWYFAAPYAPKSVTYSGFEGVYSETPRPDRKPILTRSGKALRKISMELFIGDELYDESQESALIQLEALAGTVIPLVIEYDPRCAGYWRLTSLSYSSSEREFEMDEISRATATLEFTEVPDPTAITINVGRNRPKKYRPKAGESLREIAMTYYGTASPAIISAIMDANGIDNARHIPTSIRLP